MKKKMRKMEKQKMISWVRGGGGGGSDEEEEGEDGKGALFGSEEEVEEVGKILFLSSSPKAILSLCKF